MTTQLCQLAHEHKHGENTVCYAHGGCRCDDCRDYQRLYNYWRRHSGKARYSVDATGTRRRVQALNVLGWTHKALADRLGLTKQAVQRLAYRETVWNTTADRIAALYDELCMTVPERVSYQAGVSARTRAWALQKGWVGPLAWDDIDTDAEPVEVGEAVGVDEIAVELAVMGEPVRLNRDERRGCVRRLHGVMSDPQIAERIGCTDRTVFRIRGELGLPAFVGEVAA